MSKKSILILGVIGFFCLGGLLWVGLRLDIFSRTYFEVIPFESVDSNAIIVPVTIKGKTYNFQFDTGASTSISKELSGELNLGIIDSAVSRDYYNNKKLVYQVLLPELSIGETTFSNVRAGIIRPIQSFSSNGITIHGCLGNDVLSKGVVQIDLRHQQLTIASSIRSIDVASHHGVDFLVNDQMIPYLIIDFPGHDNQEEVMFDTGSANYFYRLEKNSFLKMVNNKQLKSKDILDTLGHSANGSGVFGKQKEKEIFVVNFDSINFVGKTIYNCPAFTFSSGYSSVVGSPFLQLGIVTINYKDQKFYFKPYQDELIDLSPKYRRKRAPNNSYTQMAVQTVVQDSVTEIMDIEKEYALENMNFNALDSMSATYEPFKFDWSKRIQKAIVESSLLPKEK